MGIIKSDKEVVTTFDVSLESVKELIANDLGVDINKVSVHYNIKEVGGDPMDRFPGVKKVTSLQVKVTV